MPYKSEKIVIANTENDRRIKMTPDQKIEAIRLREQGMSYRKIAKTFSVCKSTIMFICKPETLLQNKLRREERGGWKQYYVKEKNTQAIRENRQHKQKLFLDKKITLNP